MQQSGKKRKCISLDTRYEISDLANEYEKSASTISTILSSQEKIIKEYEDNCLVNERKRIKILELHYLLIFHFIFSNNF